MYGVQFLKMVIEYNIYVSIVLMTYEYSNKE
jgi:hypothetical protein